MNNLPTWLTEEEYQANKQYWDWLYGLTYVKKHKFAGQQMWSIYEDEKRSRNLQKITDPALRYSVIKLLKTTPRKSWKKKRKEEVINFLDGKSDTFTTRGIMDGFLVAEYKETQR